MRIALIHAMFESVRPIHDAFEKIFPEAPLLDLLDGSLPGDSVQLGEDFGRMLDQRFLSLAAYAIEANATAILFTCSAFGRQIAGVKARYPGLVVCTPNEAMIREAERYERIGLVATFAPTLKSMADEFPGPHRLSPIYVGNALQALRANDAAEHDRLVTEAIAPLVGQVDCFALAQFSLARSARLIEDTTGCEVLTTPQSAVRDIRNRLAERDTREP